MPTTASTCQHDHHHDHSHADAHKGHVHEAGSSITVLSVPDMCCTTESGMVEKELRRLQGVTSITPDLMRRQVRVESTGATEAELLTAARHSGLAVELQVAAVLVPGKFERSVILIEKMDCPTEEVLIRKRLASADGVAAMTFNLMQRRLTVDHAPGQLPDVLKALQEIGLGGTVEPSGVVQAQPPASQRHASSYWKLILGGVAAAAAEALAFSVGDAHWGVIGLTLVTIALTGFGTYKKGWFAVRQRNLNINALMSVAVTGALVIGRWPEAAMVMFLFAVAEMIEAKSLDRARRAVEGLIAMTPETATVKVADSWEVVPAASVAIGTLVRARPGERIALDGQVVSGTTTVDQAPITGESLPIDKAIGDPLFAGTINQSGEVEYRTTAAANDSTLARIVRAVQDAQASKAPTQRFVDTFATYYTPVVFGVALAVAVLPPLVAGADWLTWVYRALVMLVIACPCALVISTPVTVVSGLTAAARRGILIKGGLFLEQGHRLTVLALDKTGTLTQGRPALTDIVALQGTQDEHLRIAAALARRSDHPVSMAVGAYAGDRFPPLDVAGFKAINGRGVEGVIEGVSYLLGNHRLVEELNACSPALELTLNALEEQGKTAIVLIGDGQALAIFAVADAVRPHSREAVAELKALGIEPVMLTGDNRHTAEAIARQVGITEIRSELLPEHKLEAIKEFQSHGAVVGMVGDGINDAPALAKSEIGFAMGAAGTDTAIETADVALMDDDPRKLAGFIRLSRATHSVLWQNIALALGIKAVFLALAVFGQATLWMAVFADMGASLLVVLNGLRLLRQRF